MVLETQKKTAHHMSESSFKLTVHVCLEHNSDPYLKMEQECTGAW
jgi:hypothetical protein